MKKQLKYCYNSRRGGKKQFVALIFAVAWPNSLSPKIVFRLYSPIRLFVHLQSISFFAFIKCNERTEFIECIIISWTEIRMANLRNTLNATI